MSVLTMVLVLGATARLTRLVTTDRILEAPRDWVLDRVNPLGLLTYMLGCPWCISIYVGSGAATAGYLVGDTLWFSIPALALTASYVTGVAATLTDKED